MLYLLIMVIILFHLFINSLVILWTNLYCLAVFITSTRAGISTIKSIFITVLKRVVIWIQRSIQTVLNVLIKMLMLIHKLLVFTFIHIKTLWQWNLYFQWRCTYTSVWHFFPVYVFLYLFKKIPFCYLGWRPAYLARIRFSWGQTRLGEMNGNSGLVAFGCLLKQCLAICEGRLSWFIWRRCSKIKPHYDNTLSVKNNNYSLRYDHLSGNLQNN